MLVSTHNCQSVTKKVSYLPIYTTSRDYKPVASLEAANPDNTTLAVADLAAQQNQQCQGKYHAFPTCRLKCRRLETPSAPNKTREWPNKQVDLTLPYSSRCSAFIQPPWMAIGSPWPWLMTVPMRRLRSLKGAVTQYTPQLHIQYMSKGTYWKKM